MKEPNIFERIINSIANFAYNIRYMSCKHSIRIDVADQVGLKWDRVSSVTCCDKCGALIVYEIELTDAFATERRLGVLPPNPQKDSNHA